MDAWQTVIGDDVGLRIEAEGELSRGGHDAQPTAAPPTHSRRPPDRRRAMNWKNPAIAGAPSARRSIG